MAFKFTLLSTLISTETLGTLSSPEWYLPGVTPVQYTQGQRVPLFVNELTSTKTQLPYRYYTLPYCEPEQITEIRGNLGSSLMGDIKETSPYIINFLEEKNCQVLCKKSLDSKNEWKQQFKSMIDDDYQVNMVLDNLLGTTKYAKPDSEILVSSQDYNYMIGFPVGLEQQGRYYIHNHARIIIQYYSKEEEFKGFRITGFEIEPHSVNNQENNCANNHEIFDIDANKEITYTYDVKWSYSENTWAGRWQRYVSHNTSSTGTNIHWFSILNSIMIILFLSCMVAMILIRTLWKDIAKYNELATSEEAPEETGWKLCHGDVFRKPVHSKLLAVCVGSGIQILVLSFGIVTLVCLDLLSLHFQGFLVQSMVMMFTFTSAIAGYHSARLYKMFNGQDFKTTTLMTSLLFPGVMFTVFFTLNLFIWYTGSSGTVAFKTIFTLLILWCGISTPLVFLGAYVGYKRDTISVPVRTNAIPRHIPTQPWFSNPIITILLGGILPFGGVFTELFFILSSIWQHQSYGFQIESLFGFLLIVLVILVITCVEISIALTYFQLTSEDHQWWWKSFLSSASSGIYVFLYAILYKNTRLEIDDWIPSMVYYGYSGLMAFTFSLLSGSVGLIGAFYFVHTIYSSIKID